MAVSKKDQFDTHRPLAEELKPYIAYYYFNSSKEKGYTKRFIFYPHYRNALTVYKNSKITFGTNRSSVAPYSGKPYEIIYTGIQEFCRYGEIKAPFNKIGVVFQALGINHFIKKPLGRVQTRDPQADFDVFGPEFNRVLDEVYSLSDIASRVKCLDKFFVSRLHNSLDPRLTSAVELMFEKDCLVSDVARNLEISRKTLQRLFKLHLNCSPKMYLNIIKFRRAVAIYHDKRSSLTDIAYENAYYDQSDFIKHFKKVTGFNPGRFFKSLSRFGDEDTFWTELENGANVPFLQL